MYCKNCGNRIMDDAVFCPKCGIRVAMSLDDQTVPISLAHREEPAMQNSDNTRLVADPIIGSSEMDNDASQKALAPKKRGVVPFVIVLVVFLVGVGTLAYYLHNNHNTDEGSHRKGLSGEYSISDFLSVSKDQPVVMYLLNDDAKDSEVEAVYVFEDKRVYIFPQSLLKSCFGEVSIGSLLEYDEDTVFSSLKKEYEKEREQLFQSITTSRSGKVYFCYDEPKFLIASSSPKSFAYHLILYTDRSGNKTEQESIRIPKPWGIHYSKGVDGQYFYYIDDGGMNSYPKTRGGSEELTDKLDAVSEEFVFHEAITGQFYSSFYVGYKSTDGRILISKQRSEGAYSIVLDTPGKTDAKVDPSEKELNHIREEIWTETDGSDYAWERIDKSEVKYKMVTVGITQDLDSLDPHKAVAAGTKEILYNIFEGLIKPDEDGDFVPAVAESYSVSPDGMEYDFVLRKGVKFHDGEEVTASDVVYSINRCAGRLATSDAGVLIVPELSVISDILVEQENGKDVIKVKLSTPNTELLAFLTCSIVPENRFDLNLAPVGTGPFRVYSHTPMSNLNIVKNEDYYGTKPQLDEVEFWIFENMDSALGALQHGYVDILPYLTIEQAQVLNDKFTIEVGDMSLVQGLFLNNEVKPFNNLEVRKAMNYAIDRQEILDKLNGGYGSIVGSGVYSTFGAYFNKDVSNAYPHDEDKAKELLVSAGYPDGFAFTVTVPSNYPYHVQTAKVIANQLSKVGVTMNVRTIGWADWLTEVYIGHSFEATIIGLDSKLAPSDILKYYISGTAKNFINYKSDKFDSAYKSATATVDKNLKIQLYHSMQKYLSDDAASVFIQSTPLFVALKSGVTGYRFYPVYVQDMQSINVEY